MTLNLDTLPVIESAYYGAYRSAGQITVVTMHTAETGESSSAAEGVANYFAGGGVVASSHLTVDDDSAIRCVPDDSNAYTTGEGGANQCSLQIELCGTAYQSVEEWHDPYSIAAVGNAADLSRQWVERYPWIRPVFLDTDALRRGERYGFTGHVNWHDAFPAGDVRTDPGPDFPWDEFLARVRGETPPAPTIKECDMYVGHGFDKAGVMFTEKIDGGISTLPFFGRMGMGDFYQDGWDYADLYKVPFVLMGPDEIDFARKRNVQVNHPPCGDGSGTPLVDTGLIANAVAAELARRLVQ